jgi:hypothetical protein
MVFSQDIQIKWIFRSSPYSDENVYNFTELYLYNSQTDSLDFIYGFGLGMYLNFSPKKISIDGVQSISDCSTWWAGMGIGFSIFYDDSQIRIYRINSGDGQYNEPVAVPVNTI